MLEVNKYATVDEKLNIWRAIGFIKSSSDRYTKKIRVGSKTIRVISLNMEAYNCIKTFK